jgi:phospholipase/lecithinase/hemolysin
MHKWFVTLFMLITCSASWANVQPSSFDHMVVFGDSLSDNGNLYSISYGFLPSSPPYHKGRFSNGEVWFMDLAKKYFSGSKNQSDYAIGGAGAVRSDKEVLPYTLASEISSYLGKSESEYASSTLFIIWIGGNNYLNAPTNVDQITTEVVDGIASGVERLINHGAKMIVLANLPDLGTTPQAKQDKTEALSHDLTEAHNEKLLQLYNILIQKYPDVKFALFDADKLFQDAIKDPSQYELTNTTDACYEGGYWFSLLDSSDQQTVDNATLKTFVLQQTQQSEQPVSIETAEAYVTNPVTREAIKNAYFQTMNQKYQVNSIWFNSSSSQDYSKCDQYLFWDHIHPSARTHAVIANLMDDVIQKANLSPIAQN